MIGRCEAWLRRTRRSLSRSEWAMRLLGLQPEARCSTKPGLVLIQVDGLARRQLERALARGHMPFLRYLLRRQRYHQHTFYSGLPSSTPAVQGELHYGVRCAVPAFSFYVRDERRIATMFNPISAQQVEQRLAAEAEGLLTGGASYSNIYTGGAQEAHFCASSSGWGELLRRNFPLTLPLLILVNLWSVLRIIVLVLMELGIALYDLVRGVSRGHSFFKELKFVGARSLICIVMREVIVIGAKVDVARGLPILHLNFLGYDEQAHRRGPDSYFAHWALKGIDDAIKRIWRAAHSSERRTYDVWIFADHGQEAVRPYPSEYGRTVEEAIAEIFEERGLAAGFTAARDHRLEADRARMVTGRRQRKVTPPAELPSEPDTEGRLVITAMGPIGHVYLPQPIVADQLEDIVGELISRAHLPMVLAQLPGGEVVAWTRKGRFNLPEQAAELLTPEHPFLDEVGEDLATLVRHPDVGDLVFCGWRARGKSLSFPDENGSHAGPGTVETEAWALLPKDAPVNSQRKGYLRPADLRTAALVHLGRVEPTLEFEHAAAPPSETFRIMSYNVHSCVGMDGRLMPERIARVIAQYDPDIVALQELDVFRARTGMVDQAETIATLLRMTHHFHPALRLEEERYGDAILSRFPLQLVQAAGLPSVPGREPRGALWVRVEVGGVILQMLNTHLGLSHRERLMQVDALLGPEWLGDEDCVPPAVLCGDFNALPRSQVWKKLTARMRDAQLELDRHRPRATWFGRMPLGRIDHVFISPGLEVVSIEVPRNRLAQVASDHLPVIVELRIVPVAPPAEAPVRPGRKRQAHAAAAPATHAPNGRGRHNGRGG